MIRRIRSFFRSLRSRIRDLFKSSSEKNMSTIRTNKIVGLSDPEYVELPIGSFDRRYFAPGTDPNTGKPIVRILKAGGLVREASTAPLWSSGSLPPASPILFQTLWETSDFENLEGFEFETSVFESKSDLIYKLDSPMRIMFIGSAVVGHDGGNDVRPYFVLRKNETEDIAQSPVYPAFSGSSPSLSVYFTFIAEFQQKDDLVQFYVGNNLSGGGSISVRHFQVSFFTV